MATRIVLNTISYHGKGAIENIVPELTSRGYQKALVCTDPDLVRFGVVAKVTDLLDKAAFAYEVYTDIKANPTIENVQSGVAAFQASGADCIVAIGGGSAMDTAKAVGIIVNNPEFADVRSLEGVAPTKKHAVFTIAVPTTAGTAAEVTINYVITDVEKKRKFVCVDTNDIPEVAVVDPDMMASMPPALTAATGMDALTHAIEGYITKGACAISDMFHLEAIRLISASLRAAVKDDPDGREWPSREEPRAPKPQLPKALNEDVKAVAKDFRSILGDASPMLRTYLKKARLSAGEGNVLLIVAPDEISAGALGTEEHKEEIRRLIEEKIGKQIEVEVRSLERGGRFEDSFVDLEKLIHMEITVED